MYGCNDAVSDREAGEERISLTKIIKSRYLALLYRREVVFHALVQAGIDIGLPTAEAWKTVLNAWKAARYGKFL